jgi:hypothetical protein
VGCSLLEGWQRFGESYCLHQTVEAEDIVFFRNIGVRLRCWMTSSPRRSRSECTLPLKPQIFVTDLSTRCYGHQAYCPVFNPLNVELNSICHLLVLLGNLTFMGPCIVNIFQYISVKMQSYTVYSYLETALHVSGGTCNHHREHHRIQLYALPMIVASTTRNM